MTNTKTELIYYEKEKVQEHYVLEIAIHRVGESEKYQHGIKYGLIFIDVYSGKRVLMDNHHPKGPHTHLDNEETLYQFIDIDKLVNDFRLLVLNHMGVAL